MTELNHLFAAISARPLILVALLVWSLAWKGVGLWFSARNYQRGWFVAILVLNTVGIVEIIYLLFFRRDKQPGTKSLFDEQLPDRHTVDAEEVVAETAAS